MLISSSPSTSPHPNSSLLVLLLILNVLLTAEVVGSWPPIPDAVRTGSSRAPMWSSWCLLSTYSTLLFVESSRTDPDDDDVVDVTSFSALDVVEIKYSAVRGRTFLLFFLTFPQRRDQHIQVAMATFLPRPKGYVLRVRRSCKTAKLSCASRPQR